MRLNKTINSMGEISDIIKIVTTKIDEPLLTSLNVEKHLLSNKQFEKTLKQGFAPEEEEEEEAIPYTVGLYISRFYGRHIILLRQDKFYQVFPAYFHEMCHAINIELNEDIELVLDETLAFAFEGYAKEVYNTTNPSEKFEEVTSKPNLLVGLETVIDTNLPGNWGTHIKAVNKLCELFSQSCQSYEEAYHHLKYQI